MKAVRLPVRHEVEQFEFWPEVSVKSDGGGAKIGLALGEVWDGHGGLVPVPLAAWLAGCSRNRIHQLLARGELAAVRVLGWRLVGFNELRAWATSERRRVHMRKEFRGRLQRWERMERVKGGTR